MTDGWTDITAVASTAVALKALCRVVGVDDRVHRDNEAAKRKLFDYFTYFCTAVVIRYQRLSSFGEERPSSAAFNR